METQNTNTNNFELNSIANKVAEFASETFKKHTPITEIGQITPDSILLFQTGGKKPEVKLVIVEKVDGDGKTILYRDEIMATEIKKVKPTSLKNFIRIDEIFPGEIKGDHKKDVQKLLAQVTRTVDKSVRIGGFFIPKDDADTKEMKEHFKAIEAHYSKFGLEVRFRWSDKCGKEMKQVEGDEPGFNISVLNPNKEVFTNLFRSNAYHHKHETLIEIRLKGDKLEIGKGSENIENWLNELVPATSKA